MDSNQPGAEAVPADLPVHVREIVWFGAADPGGTINVAMAEALDLTAQPSQPQ